MESGIKYYLVGGILVNIYSDFRITRDINLVLDFHISEIDEKDLVGLLKENNFFPFQDWETTLFLSKENGILQFLDKSETIRYDLHIISRKKLDKYNKLGLNGIKRREKKKIFGKDCWVASKEDFLLSKLVFGGWQDYTDALGCWMRFEEELDIIYLKEQSKILEIEREFNLLISGITDPDEFFSRLNKM